jgi:hypothetical protein
MGIVADCRQQRACMQSGLRIASPMLACWRACSWIRCALYRGLQHCRMTHAFQSSVRKDGRDISGRLCMHFASYHQLVQNEDLHSHHPSDPGPQPRNLPATLGRWRRQRQYLRAPSWHELCLQLASHRQNLTLCPSLRPLTILRRA